MISKLVGKLSPHVRAWLLVLTGVGFAFALRSGIAWAQQQVQMTALDSNGNLTIIRTDANGNLVTSTSSTPSGAAAGTHGACTNTKMTIGTTGTACPPAPRADRASILIQLVQSGQNLRVTSDGTVASSTNGINVSDGNTYTDNMAGTVNFSCRCDAASCETDIVECP